MTTTFELAPGYTVPRVIRGGWQLAGGHGGAIIDRKLNVAITRARKQMIMTGNPEILRNNQIFSELMNYVKEKGGYF